MFINRVHFRVLLFCNGLDLDREVGQHLPRQAGHIGVWTMAGVTVFVSTDVALQGADLVSGGLVPNVKKGVEMLLLNNLYVEGGPTAAGRGQCDVSALLRQGLDFLSKSPHEALGVPVGCRTPEIRKAYKKHALKYHPDKNPLTTPLFQLMSSAHDRLTDPAQRQKEERTAAAKQPKSKPPPPAAAPAPQPVPTPAPQPNHANPGQPRPTYDPKTNKWSAEAEWGKYQQPAGSEQSTKAQEAARRKQYYDEILREQFKKAESDRKAKEFAAMRDAAAKQRANANMAGAGNNGANSNANPATGNAGTAGASAQPPGATPNYYNYSNPYARKPYPKDEGTSGPASARQPTDSSAGAGYNPNYYNRPFPPSENPASAGGAYKASADGRVHPQNVPLYGKIPSREGPPGTGLHGSKPTTARTGSAAESANNNSGSAGGGAAGAGRPAPIATPAAAPTSNARQSEGIAGNNEANNSSSNNLRGGAKPNASRVPRPYGLRCLFVGANAAELEWVTSKYHRNTLLAELSWRIKEADLNSSFRQPWESASKLISSGKCRKKNLQSGAIYEFRVRAVEELSGGLLGYRSDWSDSIVVTLLPDKTTYSTGSAAGPTPGISPSQKGLASKGSYYSKHNLKEPNFSFPDTETTERARNADSSSQQTASQPNLAKPNQQPAQQPTQPTQPKTQHTFERFNMNQRVNEPKSNVYDQNNSQWEEVPPSDGRRSMPSIPVKTSLGTEESAPKGANSNNANKAASNAKDTPVSDASKNGNADAAKRCPAVNLNGSARNVWGTEKDNASTTAAGDKNDKSKAKGNANKRGERDGSVSDLEVDEDIADDRDTYKDRDKDSVGEVDDDVTVGVDEDSSSVHTSGPYKSKPKPSAPVNMTKSPPPAGSNSYHREKVDHSTDSLRSSVKSREAAAGKSTGSGNNSRGARAGKGEFEDFTIEVEDGSDEEGEDSEEDDDSFEMEYEQIYTLIAPAAKVKAKKSASNVSLIYAHPVRAEPVIKSTIIGYLNIGTEVVACADAGNWLKVKIHKQPNRKNKVGESEAEWGWSVRSDKNHEYLKLVTAHGHATQSELPPLHHPQVSKASESPAPSKSNANFKSPNGSHYTPSTPLLDKTLSTQTNPLGNRSMRALPKYPNHNTPPVNGRSSFNEKNVPVWMELFDEGGNAYYFNEATSESKWEPPDWVEERDPATNAK